MKTKVINDITYYVIKDDNDILSNMDISEKLTEYFDDFDYIVGDISYSVIRLKGFYRDSKSNNKFNKISFTACIWHYNSHSVKRNIIFYI